MSKSLLILSIALVTALTIACGRELDEPPGGEVSVVTTTYPLTFLTEKIGGDRVSLKQLVKPGVEAHDFEPAPSDVRAIAEASLFVFNHPAFEPWALNAATASASDDESTAVIVQTVNLKASDEDHGSEGDDDSEFDAHVWLNPLKALEQADRILSALIEVDPQGAQLYTRNADGLFIELRALDEQISEDLAKCELDSVVVSHLAFGHMAERYNFEQIGLAGLSPEFESGPAQIASVIERVEELGIDYILQEPIVSDRLATTVSTETGAAILTLHPIAVRTAEEVAAQLDYFDIMKTNTEVLRTALRCG